MRVAAVLFCFAVTASVATAFEMTIEEIEEHLRLLEELEQMHGDSDVQERFQLQGMKNWLTEQALNLKDKAKTALIENGGAELLAKGKALLDKLQVEVDPVTCQNNLCKCCIRVNAFPLNGKSACASFGVVDTYNFGVKIVLDEQEVFAQHIGLKSLSAVCAPAPFPLGSVCVQGLEYSQNKEKKERTMCLAVVLSQFSVGTRMCATHGPDGLKSQVQTLQAEAIAEHSKFLFKFDGKDITSIVSEFFGVSE